MFCHQIAALFVLDISSSFLASPALLGSPLSVAPSRMPPPPAGDADAAAAPRPGSFSRASEPSVSDEVLDVVRAKIARPGTPEPRDARGVERAPRIVLPDEGELFRQQCVVSDSLKRSNRAALELERAGRPATPRRARGRPRALAPQLSLEVSLRRGTSGIARATRTSRGAARSSRKSACSDARGVSGATRCTPRSAKPQGT